MQPLPLGESGGLWVEVSVDAAAERLEVHPADLDGALQLTALLAKSAGSETRLPFSIGEASLGVPRGGLWPVATRTAADAQCVWLTRPAASLSRACVLDDFRVRAVAGAAHASPVAQHGYATSWIVREAAASSTVEVSLLHSWLRPMLRAHAGTPGGGVAIPAARSLHASAHQPGTAAIGHLPHAEAALALLRAACFATLGPYPATFHAFRSPQAPLVGGERPLHSGLLGMLRSARQEVPSATISYVSLADEAEDMSRALAMSSEWLRAEPETALDQGSRRVPRLSQLAPSAAGPVQLYFDARGVVSNLHVISQRPLADPLGSGQVELHVHCVGLNFRDVLNVLGAYPGDPGLPGGDFAGEVSRTAPDSAPVGPLAPRAAIYGFASAALASIVRTGASLVACRPAAVSSEQACSLPSTWGTAHLVLMRSRGCKQHRLLLHAGAGGVGLATCQYSTWLALQSHTTVGRPYKHRFLRALYPSSSSSSRDAAALSIGASSSLLARRLHLVLNSLSHDFISTSTALLREGGHFAEIGKRGVWSRERSQQASRAGYTVVALDDVLQQCPRWANHMLRLLSRRAAAHVLRGLPILAYDLERHAVAAFRCLQNGAQVGKVVVRVQGGLTESVCLRQHLLSGGTGGLGLVAARWLVEGGASRLVLASRTPALPAAAATSLVSSSGCSVLLASCDVGEPAA
ncbi:hypothetical protein EMIHUDRAFT_213701, partial [Emiliania huxleyi CCMP1516]|uniref:Enoyl reductase (ER) domain-containing protein n=2 Tax=Emiliania huxleyi TaxID=2903 RepID=A0A0D3IMF1_EMIH1